MKIIGKSAPRSKELLSKIDNTKYLELHLSDSDVDVLSMFNTVAEQKEIDVQYVHSHLYSRSGKIAVSSTNLEYIGNFYIRGYLEKTMELAQKLSEHYKHNIGVVVHTGFKYSNFEYMGGLLYGIVYTIDELLNLYPNTYLCIENVPFISGNPNETLGCVFRSGGFDDNVRLCKYLREALPHNADRLYTLLDTCHAFASIQILKKFYPEISEHDMMYNLFELNKETIKLIHLADVINLGLDKSGHGIAFTDSRQPEMQFLMECYRDNNYNADITIEIQETDYFTSDNFRHNCAMLKEICKNLNIGAEF